jgi:hypothetical protein
MKNPTLVTFVMTHISVTTPSCDNDKLTPNPHEVQTHHYKKTCKKKINLFVTLTFHRLLRKKPQIFEPFPMGILTLLKRVH